MFRSALTRSSLRACASQMGETGKRAMSSGNITVPFSREYDTHKLPFEMPKEAVTNKEELLGYFKLMYTMRRMEITCDTEYKARAIRGFCHLYDGQEAVAMGVEAAFDQKDSWITSYRCHCISLLRGGTVESIFAELLGYSEGVSHGKGGSMHMYSKKHNFYGGQGIVGAQVPVGVGLSFAAKYATPPGEKTPVAIAMYGDGAANQGQIWEGANMASLWKLPMIFCIENNQYGMGTSKERSSSNNKYYTMGNHIPGVRMDGMNVLMVREGMKAAKEWCSTGNGPIYVESDTYRYHGHSMSDPGTTYRNRDEIASMRTARDPIEYVKNLLVQHNLADPQELKNIEKDIRKEVQDALKAAKNGSIPKFEELYKDIYIGGEDNSKIVYPAYIRMPDRAKSIGSIYERGVSGM
eukprot:TRINITY_DN3986_c0_g1_i1.p1 TRINITY_DN3986_c0_g1~~TRINITY_DN3986_c0_g1_i1.p1  ORF type:complete len:440 (+),score=184.20 TRINITY_DN3986_c0_g1_i1:94-1320(+)